MLPAVPNGTPSHHGPPPGRCAEARAISYEPFTRHHDPRPSTPERVPRPRTVAACDGTVARRRGRPLARQDVLPRSGTGLDLGCGDGRVTRLVPDELGARWTLTGLDPDELELELATSCGIYDVLRYGRTAATSGRAGRVLRLRLLEQRARARRRAGAPPRRGSAAYSGVAVVSCSRFPRFASTRTSEGRARSGGSRRGRPIRRPTTGLSTRASRTIALPVGGGVGESAWRRSGSMSSTRAQYLGPGERT